MNTAPRRKPNRKSPFRRLGKQQRSKRRRQQQVKPDDRNVDAFAPPAGTDEALIRRWFG